MPAPAPVLWGFAGMTDCFGLMQSFLSELLGCELPLIQAPMAGAQGSALAIAVGSAGGLGSLPCAMLTAEQIGSEVAALRAAGLQALGDHRVNAARLQP